MRIANFFNLKRNQTMDDNTQLCVDVSLRFFTKSLKLDEGYYSKDIKEFKKWINDAIKKYPCLAEKGREHIDDFQFRYMKFVILNRFAKQENLELPFKVQPMDWNRYSQKVKEDLLRLAADLHTIDVKEVEFANTGPAT